MPWIYHELQEAALCGVHCLNNLLQGPYFGVEDLMEIALELDRKEKALMAEMGTETEDYRKFAKEGSINVGLSGDFSANVLQEALDKVWNLKCEDTRRSDLRAAIEAAPAQEQGYLCNLEDHWIALRRLEGSGGWWNLNSLEDNPTYLSTLYLGAFLKQLQIEGWTLYVVRGEYPVTPLNHSGASWRYIPDPSESGGSNEGRGRNGGNTGYRAVDNEEERFQRELEAAIAASMQGTDTASSQGEGGVKSSDNNDDDDDAAAASAAADVPPPSNEDDEDEDLKLAILLSKQAE